jgi:hypothetical protein
MSFIKAAFNGATLGANAISLASDLLSTGNKAEDLISPALLKWLTQKLDIIMLQIQNEKTELENMQKEIEKNEKQKQAEEEYTREKAKKQAEALSQSQGGGRKRHTRKPRRKRYTRKTRRTNLK